MAWRTKTPWTTSISTERLTPPKPLKSPKKRYISSVISEKKRLHYTSHKHRFGHFYKTFTGADQNSTLTAISKGWSTLLTRHSFIFIFKIFHLYVIDISHIHVQWVWIFIPSKYILLESAIKAMYHWIPISGMWWWIQILNPGFSSCSIKAITHSWI